MIYLAGFPARLSVPPEKQITIACNGAGGRVGFEINAFRAGPLMRSVIRLSIMKHFSPLRWTILTWSGVILFVLSAAFLNTIPTRVSMFDKTTGKMQPPIQIETYKDLPIPCGWPLYYVIPANFAANNAVVLIKGKLTVTGAASLSYGRLAANVFMILANVVCFVYLSQNFLRRYTILFALGLPAIFAVLIVAIKTLGSSSIDAAWLLVLIVFFFPAIATIAFGAFKTIKRHRGNASAPSHASG
jgi:hypothetical protein